MHLIHAKQIMTTKPPILVTGSHRSGTTWVGRMLAEAPSVVYIHEPFSVSDPPGRGVCNIRFKNWFTYINAENERDYYTAISNTVNLKYDLPGALKNVRSFTDLRNTYKEYRQFSTYRHQGARTLLKDPIAVFSSAWLAEKFNAKPVILIRHPAAFISSIMKLKWAHPFDHFLIQKSMMKDLLSPFREEIEEYARDHKPLFDQAILLWRIIHYQILQYQKEHADWIFIRHEDISQDPVAGFQILFKKLDLEFTEKAETIIKTYSGSENPGDTSAPVGSEETLKRDSKSNMFNWKKRLSDSEIKEVRNRVEDISCMFYTDSEW
jgi:hypothetical protein